MTNWSEIGKAPKVDTNTIEVTFLYQLPLMGECGRRYRVTALGQVFLWCDGKYVGCEDE